MLEPLSQLFESWVNPKMLLDLNLDLTFSPKMEMIGKNCFQFDHERKPWTHLSRYLNESYSKSLHCNVFIKKNAISRIDGRIASAKFNFVHDHIHEQTLYYDCMHTKTFIFVKFERWTILKKLTYSFWRLFEIFFQT